MSGEAQYRVVLTVVDDGIKGSPLLARQAAQLIHLENDKVVSELRREPELRSKSIIHFEGEVEQILAWRRAFAQERARLVIGGRRLEGGMTVARHRTARS